MKREISEFSMLCNFFLRNVVKNNIAVIKKSTKFRILHSLIKYFYDSASYLEVVHM